METLKLEHIKPYPFGLKCKRKLSNKIFTINGEFSTDHCGVQVEEQLAFFAIENIALILHPLSSLTKEILSEYYTQLMDDDLERVVKGTQKYPMNQTYLLTQQLIEWHFDVFGLIEKGLAIDVNTLEENPYK